MTGHPKVIGRFFFLAVFLIAPDLKAGEREIFLCRNAGLGEGDVELLFDGFNAFEAGQQHAAATAPLDEDAVTLRIEFSRGGNVFQFAQHIDRDIEFGHFVLADSRKAGIPIRGRHGVVNDLLSQRVLTGAHRTNTAAQSLSLVQTDKAAGPGRQQVLRKIIRERQESFVLEEIEDALPGQLGNILSAGLALRAVLSFFFFCFISLSGRALPLYVSVQGRLSLSFSVAW